MKNDFFIRSKGKGEIHCCQWVPDVEIKGIVQIVHGIAEFIERYDDFAQFLNENGYMVVGEDHMGHGQSVMPGEPIGYFHGGWFSAIADSCQLMQKTMEENPGIPYVLFGHSMGSFMARTILCKYPNSGITGAVICGTGWQPRGFLPIAVGLCTAIAKLTGEKKPSEFLQQLVFGGYNKKVVSPRTPYDWLSRDEKNVDAYVAHPMCGFTPCSGLLRDMLCGISYIEEKKNLAQMKKDLPVLFIAGGDDPVGSYGEGVETAAGEFRKTGMQDVAVKIYPECRHEILNELNKKDIYADVLQWLSSKIISE